MGLYKIQWTEESWNRVYIEAASLEQAYEKFDNGDFPYEEIETYGQEMQNGYDVEEVQ